MSFTFYPQIEKIKHDREQRQLIDSFEQLGEAAFTDQIAVHSEEEAPIEPTAFQQQQNNPLQDARAIMKINSIDLEMVVFDGATSENLAKGIGIVEPKKELGVHNIGLAGHRAIARGKQFNRLDEVKEGDAINIQTNDENYEFIVTRTFIVNKSDVSVLEEQENPLVTLITCTPIGRTNPPDRLIVQAELKK